MEQLNPFYDEGISDNFFNLEQFSQGMSQLQINQFMHKLLSTIDLSRLSDVYFQQLVTSLGLSALKIQYEDQQQSLGDWHSSYKIKTLSCMRQGQSIATLHYGFKRNLSARDWQVLQQMHLYFSNPFKNALEHHKIKQFAMKDFLTSLGNRASFNEAVTRLINQAQRQHGPFGLLVLDLDNFKQVNDNFGHHEGDKVLVATANTIVHCLRESDFAFRFGGDEFCCLLPDTNSDNINLIAERIRHAIASSDMLQKHQVSCSVGTAEFKANDSAFSVFERADHALYQAKTHGRNCIRAA
ncbi:MAG: GGDEF domain-containing protein [Paraglaciecola sp.]|nr:GGDEF domain-containing protein [Paraglaciecola sp.]NCT48050.1 GGDEF domain-containing protein [Paraglaciecola sp.]